MMSVSVSIIVPAYNSQGTILECLRHLEAQTWQGCEIIVVDSSPGTETDEVLREQFPDVKYFHLPARLLPHEARNLGTSYAQGDLLIFTDPDIYAPPFWVEGLVRWYEQTGHVIVGALECYGDRWLDKGIHLAKFDKWLPTGEPRPVDISPTANMLIDRTIFERVGLFEDDLMLGDSVLSWRLTSAGQVLWFVPELAVCHHHISTLPQFLRERFARGREFARLRPDLRQRSWLYRFLHAAATLLPVRLARLMLRTGSQAYRSGDLTSFVLTLPISLTGHACWLAGEMADMLRL